MLELQRILEMLDLNCVVRIGCFPEFVHQFSGVLKSCST